MTDREAIDVLFNEWKCIDRNDGIHCDRKCESCDLVMDVGIIREAFNMAISALQAQDSPKPTAESAQNVPKEDLISRKAAIDALRVAYWDDNIQSAKDDPCIVDAMTDWAIRQVKALPSAQPEIIRCKDCKYQDENWRRVSVRWLPCMDVRTGSNWYCGSAERGDRSEQ